MRKHKPVRHGVRRISRVLWALLRRIGLWIDKRVVVNLGSNTTKAFPTVSRYILQTLEPRLLLSADLGFGPAFAFQSESDPSALHRTMTAASEWHYDDYAPVVRFATLGTTNSEWHYDDYAPAAPFASRTVIDANGVHVDIVLTGPGSLLVTPVGVAFDLELSGTTAESTLTVTTTGNELATLRNIGIDGALGSFNATTTDVIGNLLSNGALGSLSLHAWADTDATPNKLKAVSIGTLSVAGNFGTGVQLSGAASGFTLGVARIGGSANGHWNIVGRSNQVYAGSTAANWAANFSGGLSLISTTGDLSGQLSSPAIQLIQVGGNLNRATILAGANLGADAALGGTGNKADQFTKGTLARLRVSGSVNGSDIRVGVDPVDAILDNGDDQLLGPSTIQELLIGGSLSADSRIVAGAFPATVRVNGQTLDPQTLPQLATHTLVLVSEANRWVTRVTLPVELGQTEGSRTLRVTLSPHFDTRGPSAVLEDLFQIYLVDPSDHSHTLLDRGTPGTALFSLGGSSAEYLPGLVRFDGSVVSIDLTSLGHLAQGLLVFQMINSDADTGSRVEIVSIANELDPEGVASPVLPIKSSLAAAGAVVDLAALHRSADVQALIGNVRLDPATGLYKAELRVRNDGPDLSRKIAVLFPGLPAGVTLLTPSGANSNGNPYINMRAAAQPGGLQHGVTSDPIEITFTDPSLVRFSLRPRVLVGGPNRAPVFEAVEPLTVRPGGNIEVELVATDPDGDPITFSMQSDGALPTGTLKANGRLVFNPAPGQEGNYQFKLIASDGSAKAEQNVSLSVTTDPLTTTRISGQLLATDHTPLAGVPVTLSRLTVLTDAQGRFTLDLPSHLLPTEPFSLVIPTGDPQFDPLSTGTQTISFRRARFDTETGTSPANPRLHTNLVSSFLDASMVYGSDDARALALRTLSGGRLKTSPGDLMPFNSLTYFPDGPLENDVQGTADPTTMFVAGDVRASENVALSALHIVLLREHNRLAAQFAAADSSLSDEQLYQRARRMVNALIQQVTYSEYLPLLLGPTAITPYTGYNPDVNPEAGSFFATAAFRIGHSQMVSQLLRLDANGDPLPGGPLSLREAFSTTAPIVADGIDPLLRGLVAQQAQNIDTKVVDELRNFLFGPPGSGGMDLPAMDIQRARDMGLPSYTQARLDFGLSPITSFSQISSDVAVQQALQTTYGTVDKIDALVGGIAEDHAPGSMVGALFGRAIAQEFTRARDGDRFWYENSQFTAAELAAIRSTTLADLIQRNTAITGLPSHVLNTGPAPIAPAPAGSAASEMPDEFRSLDGLGNNVADPDRGRTGQDLLIDSSLHYADGISAPNGSDRPLARAISNGVMAQTGSIANTSGATALAIFWGQILAHDISLTPTGTTDTLNIHGEDAHIADKAFPFIAERLGLLLGHDVYEGVDNVIERSIYLPALDIASGKVIDPAVETVVHADLDHDGTPDADAMVTVAAHTLVDREGNPFTGTLSITEVPSELTPAALPANLFPDLVVTIQPGDMVFNTPAPLTLPNRAGYAPGTQMDLWSINPVTGQFDVVGKAEVSADGSKIETTEGGIRNSSWHFVAPPPSLDLVTTNPHDEDDGCDDCPKATATSNSEVELHSGALLETHDLVPYQSLGTAMGFQLVYDSMRADPRPIVHFGYNRSGSATDAQYRLIAQMTVSRGDFRYEVPGFAGGQYGLTGGEHFWSLPAGGGAIEAALQVDLGSPDSGLYNYTLNSGLRRFDGSSFAGSAATSTGMFLIVNAVDSIFGAGWGLSGLSELVENPDGSALLINGNSSQLLFKAPTVEGGAYMSPPGQFSTLIKLPDGRFQRTDKDQTVYAYNAANKLASVTNRDGNQTQYRYDGQNRLIAITDPVGLETLLDYSGTSGGGVRVTAITDPAGRETRLEYDTAGNLVRITDPDGTRRTWEYDARHHMSAEIDKRGEREQSSFDFAGRVTGSVHKDGSTQSFAPVQTRSLLPPQNTIDPFAAPAVFSLIDQAESDHTDANGNVTHTVLNQRGAVLYSFDGAGGLPTLERDDRNLVTKATDGRGNETTYGYDDQGNLLSVSDPVAFGGGGKAVLFPGPVFPTDIGARSVVTGDVDKDGDLDIVTANYNVRTGFSSVSVLRSNGDGTFSADRRDYTLPRHRAESIALGYVDEDDNLDIVTGTNGFAHVLLGNGDGTFAARVDFALIVGTTPLDLALGDVDGDESLDIVTANYSSFSVLLGRGDGTFDARKDFALALGGAYGVALGYMDADENLDIVTVSLRSSSVSIFLGNGDATFGEQSVYAVGSRAASVALGYVDEDANLDIVTAGNAASVLLGNGDGTFGAREDFALPASAGSVALGDLDGDDDLDIVSASSNSLSVLLGEGDGTFGAHVDYTGVADGGQANSLALGDMNGDGSLDIVATAQDSLSSFSAASLLLGNGDGTFVARVDYGLGATASVSVAMGDVDKDGDLDIVTANYTYQVFLPSSLSVLRGTGDGTFADLKTYTPASRVRSVALGDVDKDGDLDIVTANNSYSGYFSYTPSSTSVLLGNGDGTFAGRHDIIMRGAPGATSVALGDVNGDAHLDIVTANSSSFSVLLGRGDGTFRARKDYTGGGQSVTLADVNGDEHLDIVAASYNSALVLLGTGEGTFAAATPYAVAAIARSAAVGDVNRDKKLDIVTAGSAAFSVLLGVGDGNFAGRKDYNVASGATSVALADVDGDDDLDVVTVNTSFSSSVLLGNGDGSFAARVDYALNGGALSVALGDVDRDGDPDIVTANSYTSDLSSSSVLLNQGAGDDSIPHGRGHRDFTYDPVFNQMTGMTDELGQRTLFDLDPANGDVLKATRVVGLLDADSGETDDVVTSFSYLDHGLVDLMTDPLGRVTDYDYDAFGRLVKVTVAKGTADEASMRYEYDAAGNRSAVIDENGHRTEYRYDALNRLTHVTEADPDGPGSPLASPETDLVYDQNGNLTRVTDAKGNVTVNEYDAMNRLARRTDPDPDGAVGPAESPVSAFGYDEQGNLFTATDPLGHVTRYFYDARNRIVSTTDPDGGTTRFRYDSDNNRTSVTDPLGNITRFAYDQRDRVTQETDPLGKKTQYTYDPADNLIAVTDRNGRITRYTYDDLDRQVTETWQNASGAKTNTIDYAYDKASNLLSIADDFSQLTYTYDQRDRVKTEDNLGTPEVPQVALAYRYDGVGNVLSVSDAIGGSAAGQTSYTYDALNRMTSVQQTGTNVADKRADFAFNPLGQYETVMRYSDLQGTSLVVGTAYAYDSLNRLASITHRNAAGSAVSFFNFEHDAQSRITAITDVDGRTDYSYDRRDELTGAKHADAGNPDETYVYDANGNRVSSSLHGTGYVTGPGNRLLSDGVFDYGYDDEGNMVSRTEIATGEVREFDYDQRNRLVRVTDRASAGGIILQEVNFVYDALNRRIGKVVDANGEAAGGQSAIYLVYDREDVILDFVDGDGVGGVKVPVLAVRYLHGPGIDMVLAQETYDLGSGLSTGVQWLLTDHLGTTRDLANNAGVVVNHIKYGSYGNVVAQSDASVASRYLFTGREFDSETGLYYYRARYYEARIGRFLSEDPIGLLGGDKNIYRYINNSVMDRIDPLGSVSFRVTGPSLRNMPRTTTYGLDNTQERDPCPVWPPPDAPWAKYIYYNSRHLYPDEESFRRNEERLAKIQHGIVTGKLSYFDRMSITHAGLDNPDPTPGLEGAERSVEFAIREMGVIAKAIYHPVVAFAMDTYEAVRASFFDE